MNENKVSGNGRIVQTMPKLAINVTAREEDLLNQVKYKDDLIRFYLFERTEKDIYQNDFILFKGSWQLLIKSPGAIVSSRSPRTIISVGMTKNMILKEDFQRLKNKSGFIKLHLLELEYPDSHNNHFEILPGHFNYVHKKQRVA